VSEHVFFLKVLDLRIKSLGVRKNLCPSAASSGENWKIFSIVLFLPSVFARMVDVVPDVGFRLSWCHRKSCATFSLKVLDLHRGELGFARCGSVNRGCRSVFHSGGSFSDRDFGSTGETLDDPKVARCS
jgi:hypothetical protein